MGFKENMLKKIEIDQLAQKVIRSLGLPDSAQRMDRDAMKALLDMGPFAKRRERDLDLYLMDDAGAKQHILVLDNELKLYNTTIEDVALRKSPTVKEMVSIRNAIKILNDKDVVVSRKADTVRLVQEKLVTGIDLSFSAADIDALVREAKGALENKYAEGVIEILTLFAELLGFRQAPRPFQLPHHIIWGLVEKTESEDIQFGPLVMYSLMHNTLKGLSGTYSQQDPTAMERYRQTAAAGSRPDVEGEQALESLKTAVLNTQRKK
jgi:hypothetical protein